MNREELQKLADDAASRLGKHAESVVIIVTAAGPSVNGAKTSQMVKSGAGNYYAQRGSAEAWVERQRHVNLAEAISDVMPQEPPDDGDRWKRGG